MTCFWENRIWKQLQKKPWFRCTIHYRVIMSIIDQSTETPLKFLYGVGQIIPGLEKALAGKKTGDKLSVKVSPEEGYGEVDQALILTVPKTQLSAIPNLEVGLQIGETQEGKTFVIRSIAEDHAVLDANHPLAGVNLNFDVEVVGIRPLPRKS